MNRFIGVLSLLILQGYVSSASAIPMSTVGSTDTFLASTKLASSDPALEQAWIESVLGASISYTQLDGSVSGGSNWLQVQDAGNNDIAGQYAFQFAAGSQPDYYLVKTGKNSGVPDLRDFLFLNLSSLNWANINLTLSDGYVITNIGKVSHVGIDANLCMQIAARLLSQNQESPLC